MNIDEIINKIKKAVRLANKTTEQGERETALRLAKTLADKNGLAFEDFTESDTVADKVHTEDGERHTTDTKVDGHISVTLRNHFGVIALCVRDGRKTYFTYFGSRLNIDISKFVAHILRREANKAWKQAREEFKELDIDMSRGAFLMGFFFKIHKKLLENPIRNDIEADAAEAKEAYEEYKKNANINEKTVGGDVKDKHAECLYRGYMMADGVSLNRPCSANECNGEIADRVRIEG